MEIKKLRYAEKNEIEKFNLKKDKVAIELVDGSKLFAEKLIYYDNEKKCLNRIE